METAEKLKSVYGRIVEFNEERLNAIRAEIESREEKGQAHADLDADLAQARTIASKGEARALENLKKAQEAEAQQEIGLQQERKAKDNQRKTDALRLWVQNGGDPKEFETAWNSIRIELIQKAVIEDMTQKPSAGVGSKPL